MRVVAAVPIVQIAAAVVRRDDDVLLVEAQGPNDPQPRWVLPGGVVEEGEFITEALVREVREEAGLDVKDAGRLLWITNVVGAPGRACIAFIFEVAAWDGEPIADDPDGIVSRAAFFPVDDAVQRLEAIEFAGMGEPAAAYLRGDVGPGAVWLYRWDGEVNEFVRRFDSLPVTRDPAGTSRPRPT